MYLYKELGCAKFLPKPFFGKELEQAINDIIMK